MSFLPKLDYRNYLKYYGTLAVSGLSVGGIGRQSSIAFPTPMDSWSLRSSRRLRFKVVTSAASYLSPPWLLQLFCSCPWTPDGLKLGDRGNHLWYLSDLLILLGGLSSSRFFFSFSQWTWLSKLLRSIITNCHWWMCFETFVLVSFSILEARHAC